jgi:hypothetical protein
MRTVVRGGARYNGYPRAAEDSPKDGAGDYNNEKVGAQGDRCRG